MDFVAVVVFAVLVAGAFCYFAGVNPFGPVVDGMSNAYAKVKALVARFVNFVKAVYERVTD